MSDMDQEMLLTAMDGLFSTLERETLSCLKNMESMPAQEIERFVVIRREILSAIQMFDTEIGQYTDRPGWNDESSLKKFRQRQAAVLARVIEAEGLLLALAEMRLTSFKAKLADISQGRGALHGYREESGVMRSPLKHMA